MFREAHSDPAFAEVIDDVMASGGVVAGIMHTKLAHVDPVLDVLRRHWSGPLMVYAEDGDESMPIDWGLKNLVTLDDYAALAKRRVGERSAAAAASAWSISLRLSVRSRPSGQVPSGPGSSAV